MVMAILRRSLGEKRAFEMIALGNSIDADTAYRFGLVNRVFEAETFDQEAAAFLESLASRSASAVARDRARDRRLSRGGPPVPRASGSLNTKQGRESYE
jgi:enoyl-CoA hydratase/carnithine racemase